MKKSRVLPLFALAAAPLFASLPARATNPCDLSETACEEWKKALHTLPESSSNDASPYSKIPARACDVDQSLCAPDATPAPVKRPQCAQGRELEGRGVEVRLVFADTSETKDFKLSPLGCELQNPGARTPAKETARRDFASSEAGVSVYSDAGSAYSTLSLRLAGGVSSVSAIPAFLTSELASGRSIDLGEVLLLREAGKGPGQLVAVKLSVRSVAP